MQCKQWMLESCFSDEKIKRKLPEDTLDVGRWNELREEGNAFRGEVWNGERPPTKRKILVDMIEHGAEPGRDEKLPSKSTANDS